MGSFRSQPETTKHTECKPGLGLTYVSTHMCGKLLIIKDGEFICKMHTLLYRQCQIKNIPYSQYLTVMEV